MSESKDPINDGTVSGIKDNNTYKNLWSTRTKEINSEIGAEYGAEVDVKVNVKVYRKNKIDIRLIQKNIEIADKIFQNSLTKVERKTLELEMDILKNLKEELLYDLEDRGLSPDINYPLISDVNFNKKLYNLQEFSKFKSSQQTSIKFKLSKNQLFAKEYVNIRTPYNGLLIFHGVGVGKTCSGLLIAENFKKYMPLFRTKILIICPSENILNSWKNEIFNTIKEFNKKGIDNVQCTGDEYINMYERLYDIYQGYADGGVANIEKNMQTFFENYYEFTTYNKLSNLLEKKMFNKTEAEKIAIIRNEYSNRVIIMDEIHETRNDYINIKNIFRDDTGKIVDNNGRILEKNRVQMIENIQRQFGIDVITDENLGILYKLKGRNIKAIENLDNFIKIQNIPLLKQELIYKEEITECDINDDLVNFIITKIYGDSFEDMSELDKNTNLIEFFLDDRFINDNITNQITIKKSAQYLEMLSRYADNIKLILLSATPMYDTPEEIIWLINLLRWNDNLSPVIPSEIIKSLDDDGDIMLQEIKRKSKAYISYVRGENPFSFPKRYYPTDTNSYIPNYQYFVKGKDIVKFKEGKTISEEKGVQLLNYPTAGSLMYDHKLAANISFKYYKSSISEEQYSNLSQNDIFKSSGIDNIQTRLLNITYSNCNTLLEGRGELDKKILDDSFNSVLKLTANKKYQYKNVQDDIFHIDNLGKYSGKILNILRNVIGHGDIPPSSGIVFVFSSYIKYGILPVALALERNGFKRVTGKSNQLTESNLLVSNKDIKRFCSVHNKHCEWTLNCIQAKYIYLTSDSNPQEIEFLRKEVRGEGKNSNVNGEHILAILGTPVVERGISFLNIREIHILEPWYNLNKTNQVIGRGFRNKSHFQLEEGKRNICIYLHTVSFTDLDQTKKYNGIRVHLIESSDESTYRLALNKEYKINKVTEVLRNNSVDCGFNRDLNTYLGEPGEMQSIINSKGVEIDVTKYDIDFSDRCLFGKCKYICNDLEDIGDIKDEDNYLQLIIDLYKKNYIYSLKEIIDILSEGIGDVNISRIYIVLDSILKNTIEVTYNNIQGTIIYYNNYYIFQPIDLTNNRVFSYFRINIIKNLLSKTEINKSEMFIPIGTDYWDKINNILISCLYVDDKTDIWGEGQLDDYVIKYCAAKVIIDIDAIETGKDGGAENYINYIRFIYNTHNKDSEIGESKVAEQDEPPKVFNIIEGGDYAWGSSNSKKLIDIIYLYYLSCGIINELNKSIIIYYYENPKRLVKYPKILKLECNIYDEKKTETTINNMCKNEINLQDKIDKWYKAMADLKNKKNEVPGHKNFFAAYRFNWSGGNNHTKIFDRTQESVKSPLGNKLGKTKLNTISELQQIKLNLIDFILLINGGRVNDLNVLFKEFGGKENAEILINSIEILFRIYRISYNEKLPLEEVPQEEANELCLFKYINEIIED